MVTQSPRPDKNHAANQKWDHSAVGELTGIGPLYRSFLRPLERLERIASGLGFWSWRLKPLRRGLVEGTPEDRFLAAIKSAKLTDADIKRIQTRVAWQSIFFLLLAAVSWLNAIVVLGHQALVSGFNLPIAQDIYVVLFPPTTTLLALTGIVRHYQLQNRSLVTSGEFFSMLGRASPKSVIDSLLRTISHANFLGVLCLIGPVIISWLLFPHEAFAQSASASSTPMAIDAGQASTTLQNAYGLLVDLGPTDLSGQWLARLFPAITGGGTSTDMLSQLIADLNTVLLDVGGALVLWQGAFVWLNIAEAGSFEGGNYHAAISPLRALVGGVSLAPLVGGYCLMQIGALQILAGGYWLADTVNAKMQSMTFSPSALSQNVQYMPPGDMHDLLNSALSAETCWVWLGTYVQQLTGAGVVSAAIDPFSPFSVSDNLSVQLTPPFASQSSPSADGTNAEDYDFGICGKLSVGALQTGNGGPSIAGTATTAVFQGGSAFNQSRDQALQKFLAALWATGLPQDLASTIQANAPTSADNSTSTDPVTAVSASKLQTELNSAEQAATAYLQSVQGAAQTLTTTGLTPYAQATSTTASNLGWASAGALYSSIAQMFATTSNAISGSVPSLVVTTLDGVSQDERRGIQSSYDVVDDLMSSSDLPDQATMTAGSTNSTANNAVPPIAPTAGQSFSEETSSQRVLDQPAAAALFRLQNLLTLDPSDPIAGVVSDGLTMMHTGEIIIAVSAVVNQKLISGAIKGASAVAGAVAGGGDPATAILGEKIGGKFADLLGNASSFVLLIGEILIFIGAFQTYVIPMLFYIAWIYQIVNCIAFAAEFVLAAPLAGYKFMKIDGREPVGQDQKAFFVIAFMQGVLRPTLMLFGLAISTYVFSAIATVFNVTFKLGIASANSGSIIGPIGIFTYMIMMAFIQWQVCVRCISLIGTVPDQVANIVGGATATLFGHGDAASFGQGLTSNVRGFTGGAIGYVLGGQQKDRREGTDKPKPE